MEKQKGFTLIELLLVVAIVGILARIALPAYSEYVLRSKLTEAITELAGMRVNLEQYYQDNRTYGNTATTCIVPVPVAPSVKYFSYTCGWRTGLAPAYPGTDGTPQSFMVTATGIASTPTAGFVYTIDQLNAKQTTAVPAGWTGSSTCWITKKGGVC